jgi:hypothetical protein
MWKGESLTTKEAYKRKKTTYFKRFLWSKIHVKAKDLLNLDQWFAIKYV